MKVLLNSKDRTSPRQEVEAELIKETKTTFIVKLPDGHIVSRKKMRDVPGTEVKKDV